VEDKQKIARSNIQKPVLNGTLAAVTEFNIMILMIIFCFCASLKYTI